MDTSGLLCLIAKGDARHESSVLQFEQATNRVTHSLVLAEFVPLARTRGVPMAAVLRFLEDLLRDPLTETCWVDEGLFRAGLALVQRGQTRRTPFATP